MSKNKKEEKKKMILKKSPNGGFKGSFFGNFLISILILFFTISLFSLISGNNKKEKISISEVASSVRAGEVKEIKVETNTIEVTFNEGEVKTSVKEASSSIVETLSAYGVTEEELSKIKIDVSQGGGFWYWVLNLSPFLFPILFIGVFFWLMTRQVKGAGMQAFSFGQSRARMTDPADQKQRVTFKDVAGCKEAKEELSEIVDFLKNPKKFFEIGARIPKGILLMGAPGTGKCITGDTLIQTSKGIIPIEDMPKYFTLNEDSTIEGLEIVTLDSKSGILKKASASHWYNLGLQETLSIRTDSGLKIEGTPEHPVVVIDQETGHFRFKELSQIEKNDWLVTGYNTQVFGSYTKIPSPEVAYMLGVLTGDGCLTIKDRIILSTKDGEVLERIQSTSEKYLGSRFSKSNSRPYDYELRSAEAKSRLISWGLGENYAKNKKMPEWIQFAPKKYVQGFIRGLFDADGTVEKNGGISFSSSSKILVEQVQISLLNLGIVARSYERRKKYNNKIQGYVAIYGDFVLNFKNEIGFSIKRKALRLEAVCSKQRNTNVNLIPLQGELIKKVWAYAVATTEENLNRKFYSENLYKNMKRYVSGERTPSINGMSNFIDGVSKLSPYVNSLPEIAHLKNLSSGNYFFTKVSEIKKGSNTVYDLTVPVTHNFLANGFINHNTLLARAVAGEAGVAFFSISGSEFVEMFVGVGASRVRDLFQIAKKAAPAIIFMDEIDAVGRVRGGGMGGGNDEREQTLNQILVEMDGFEPTEKVVVMAATNRPDVLDPALLRPGRFDRRVTIDLPDRNDREEILKIHSRSKPFAEDVDLKLIAERTPGFSGADLYSLMNEGAILAARENRTKISQFDLIRSIEKVMLGPERRSHILSTKEKEITAYHEAGHALVASLLPNADPVHKISIISRGRAAGYTLKLPIEDRKLQSRNEFLDDIAMSLGGYVTEKMIFGDLTTGPSNDLQVSTAMARDMVTKYGMSENLGPVALEGSGGKALFGRGVNEKEYSEEIGALIDKEVSKIMKDAYSRAEKIITEYRNLLDVIAKRLIETETIEKDEFEQILIANGVQPKKAEQVS